MSVSRPVDRVNIAQLARAADLPESTVRSIISGKHKPGIDRVVKLAAVMGVEVGEFWRKVEAREYVPEEVGRRREE